MAKPDSRQHFLFGYGSLMSHDSRMRFTDIDAQGIPVHVEGWHRAWSMCCPIENYTCVGAVPVIGRTDVALGGVIVPIAEITETLRKREQNYHFVELDKNSIRHFSAGEERLLTDLLEDAVVWICQVSSPGMANDDFPIYQTYVDTCIAGCLESADETFAKKFIEDTGKWDSVWLNDRADPQYPRAARLTQEIHTRIDDLLQQFDLLRFRQDDP